jgi:DNA-binding beta-propeller fold protein YncE
MYVALGATGEIVRLDGISQTEISRAQVGETVRGLSVSADGNTLLASRFVTPKVPGEEGASPDVTGVGGIVEVLSSDLTSLGSAILQHSNRLPSEHSGPGLPNYLNAPVITPDGLAAWVPSKQDNILRGTIRNGLPLVHDQTVRAITSKIDLGTQSENFTARVDHDNASIASAAMFDNTGAFLYVALEGNRQIAITDSYQSSEIYRFDTGRAPQGLAMSPSGDKLFVHNFMDRSVTIHDLSAVHALGELSVPLLATVQTV